MRQQSIPASLPPRGVTLVIVLLLAIPIGTPKVISPPLSMIEAVMDQHGLIK
jgi:hypothetical protein